MIELECPKCEIPLQLDDGYRGGVCRCYECGTMITVPDEDELYRIPEELFIQEEKSGAAATLGSTTVFRTHRGIELELSNQEVRSIPVAERRARPPVETGSNSGVWIALGVFGLVIGLAIAVGVSRAKREKENTRTARVVVPTPAGEVPTLEQLRSAIPDADDDFLIGQMNKAHTLERAKRNWMYEKRRRAADTSDDPEDSDPAPVDAKPAPSPTTAKSKPPAQSAARPPKNRPRSKPTAAPKAPTLPEAQLSWESKIGRIIDDTEAQQTGPWQAAHDRRQRWGAGYMHDAGAEKGSCTIVFPLEPPRPGVYALRLAYASGTERDSAVPWTVRHADGETSQMLDQSRVPALDGLFEPLGRFRLEPGAGHALEITNRDTTGVVTADAVQMVPLDLIEPTARPDGLIARWRFDDNAADSVGGHHARLGRGATFAPGRVGQALALESDAQPARVAYHPMQRLKKFTLAGWFHAHPAWNAAQPGVLLGNYRSKHNTGFDLRLGRGEVIARLGLGTGAEPLTTTVALGEETALWIHAAATFDGKALKLYLNGSLAAETPWPLEAAVAHQESDLLIGHHLTGLIDDIRLYDRAWGAEAIRSMATAGASEVAAAPASPPTAKPDIVQHLLAHWPLNAAPLNRGANAQGDALQADVLGTPRLTQGGTSFNGLQDGLRTTVTNGPQRTLAVWVLPRSAPDVDTLAPFFHAELSGEDAFSLGLDDGRLKTMLDGQTWNTDVALELRRWQHVAIAYDAGGATLYVNGKPVAKRQQPVAAFVDAPYTLGRNDSTGAGFDGLLADARVYDRVLGDAEVASIMQLAPPIKPAAPTGPAFDPSDLRRRVLPAWAAAARRTMQELGTFPKDTAPADFALDADPAFAAEALRLLSTKLDRDAAIDGHLKLRLFNTYQPALGAVDTRQALDLLDHRPRPQAPRLPSAREMKILQVAEQEVLSERAIATLVQAIENRLRTARTNNAPTLAYQQHLIEGLPQSQGVRLLARTLNLRDRYSAGEKMKPVRRMTAGAERDAPQAVHAMLQAAEQIWLDRAELSAAVRTRLIEAIGQIERLQEHEVHVMQIVHAELSDNGRVTVRRLGPLLDEESLKLLSRFLTTKRPE